MTGRVLLDTSAVIDLFAGNPAVGSALAEASEVYVPAIALGELFYGARKSSRVAANLAQVEAFAALASVLPCDIETARRYGTVKDVLRARGRPLPENDIWIAALALQHEMTLATSDAHFRQIGELPLLTW